MPERLYTGSKPRLDGVASENKRGRQGEKEEVPGSTLVGGQ